MVAEAHSKKDLFGSKCQGLNAKEPRNLLNSAVDRAHGVKLGEDRFLPKLNGFTVECEKIKKSTMLSFLGFYLIILDK
jgi:hypothetical protein